MVTGDEPSAAGGSKVAMDKEYWATLMPDAVQAYEEEVRSAGVMLCCATVVEMDKQYWATLMLEAVQAYWEEVRSAGGLLGSWSKMDNKYWATVMLDAVQA